MFISHKSNVIQHIHELEWNCRRKSKGLTRPEYWAWLETITDAHGVVTYPSEDFTIVECTDEDVTTRLAQLDDYIGRKLEGKTYNIKYYATKRDSEIDGVKSHFIGDDTAKDKRLLDAEWEQIRKQRTRLLAETDHHALSDQTLSDDMKTYRKSLRDLPSDQSSKTKYSDITWPTKP
jgi:hypothetical protein